MKILLLLCAAVLPLMGGCTSTWSQPFSDGSVVEAVTISNLWSPNVTVVKLPDGSYQVLGGSSTAGQLAGPVGYVWGAYRVEKGLSDSGDTVNASASGGNAEAGGASAVAGVEIDIENSNGNGKGLK